MLPKGGASAFFRKGDCGGITGLALLWVRSPLVCTFYFVGGGGCRFATTHILPPGRKVTFFSFGQGGTKEKEAKRSTKKMPYQHSGGEHTDSIARRRRAQKGAF